MSKAKKAEQKALEAYPVKEEWIGNQYGSYGDVNERFRGIYQEGYHQAEKDLELTWEDIKEICDLSFEEACRLQRNMKGYLIYKEQHYQEVLKRIKNMKK